MSRFCAILAAALMAALSAPALADGVGGSDVSGAGMDGSGVGYTGSNTINVQTNIDTTKVIDSSSNIVVNKVFNGVNVGYGLGGASVLGVINQRSADAQAVMDQRQSAAQQVQSQASYIAQAFAAYGGY